MFDTVLVANRGEIAVRVIRACRDMGLRSVAVYSDADRLSPHVLLADQALSIGGAPAAESYLRGDRIIEAAQISGAGAIHPGYGFLAERARFAQDVEESGLVFIGPRPASIQAMGDKTEARRRMSEAGIPIVPGGEDPVRDSREALRLAEDLGFPVLLKAVAGGGGKGMRLVHNAAAMSAAFEAAVREAEAAFGDGSIYVEKLLLRPRHIEFQILADDSGNVLHLGERECSIQRRHQKLIEEAPSTVLTPTERVEMGAVAVRAAQAVDYRGVGTVEFLYDEGNFYFLEMNTRLQVEHPVTELVTGLDLVEWQIRVARGEPLGFSQDDVSVTGHAIECRITSEDPRRDFLPSAGRIDYLAIPAGPGTRWDGGIASGFEVSLHYDPLLGKLIVHAENRAGAIRRMKRALDELEVSGVETCVPFHRRVMAEEDFANGRLSVAYVEEHPELFGDYAEDHRVAAMMAAVLEHEHRSRRLVSRSDGRRGTQLSTWRASGWPWRK
jgi:acetyl-CoA carboxylase biotin carboxylase subunit